MKKIGIALGAGGARGLAHICFLQVFEELGIKPAIISGTSIGAIIGAVYSAGLTAQEIKDSVFDLIFSKSTKFWEIYKRSDLIKAFSFIDPQIKQGGLIKGEKFVHFLGDKLGIHDFDQLKIPLKISSTDFYTNNAVVISSGNVLNAVRASYAIPGLFAPVEWNSSLLIDGGITNPLPYDTIIDECDICVAIDVTTDKSKKFTEVPAAYEMLFAGFSMMQRSIVREKLKSVKPEIYIDTNIMNVRVHEFTKIKQIFEQTEPLKLKLKNELEKLLD